MEVEKNEGATRFCDYMEKAVCSILQIEKEHIKISVYSKSRSDVAFIGGACCDDEIFRWLCSADDDDKIRMVLLSRGKLLFAVRGEEKGLVLQKFSEAVTTYLWWCVVTDLVENANAMRLVSDIIFDCLKLIVEDTWTGFANGQPTTPNMQRELLGETGDLKSAFRKKYEKKLFMDYPLPSKKLLIHMSAQKYEGRETETVLYFIDRNEKCRRMIDVDCTKNEDYQISYGNIRMVRKMMELAGKRNGLIVQYGEENGEMQFTMLGVANKPGDCKIHIRFSGFLTWDILMENAYATTNRIESVYSYSILKEEIPLLDDQKNKSEILLLADYLGKSNEDGLQELEDIVRCAMHGTAVIFLQSKVLDYELRRLRRMNRVTVIRQINLKNMLKCEGVMAIDGAIMADIEGNCRGIGAIVDGMAVVEGDISRGARYNSVHNYIVGLKGNQKYQKEYGDFKAAALIRSEDGMTKVVLGVDSQSKVSV